MDLQKRLKEILQITLVNLSYAIKFNLIFRNQMTMMRIEKDICITARSL